MYRWVLMFMLSVFSFSVQSHTIPELSVEQANATPYVEIGTFLSEPNEQLTPFLLRTAHVLQDYTAQTKHEACASIAFSETTKQWGIRLISIGSSLMCVINHQLVPEGMQSVRLSIHSHPQGSSVRPSQFDVEASKGALSQVKPFPLSRRPFSAPDYASGPGYVVTLGRVYYQAGKGTEQNMGDVAETSVVAVPTR